MNKTKLKTSIGTVVQLRPAALDDAGRPIDIDWIIRAADDSRIELQAADGTMTAVLGTDHVYSYVSNPARDIASATHGFLQLLVQVFVSPDGVYVEPIPPPKTPGFDTLAYTRRFNPLVVNDSGVQRYFSWRGRDPLHLIEVEEAPRQLLRFAAPLCAALRRHSGMEPQFNVRSDIRGEIVYELAPDLLAKWQLLGGMGDGPGHQVLVLVTRP